MQVSVTYLSDGQAALRIRAPETTGRVSAHFILLLDISDSMNENSKLEHVKVCTTLLLKFMTPTDRLSVITFGQTSDIILTAVETDSAHLSSIEAAIEGLVADGCTNLSAGLASVQQVLQAGPGGVKPALFLLTDGHANAGVVQSTSLQDMVSRLVEQFPELSLSVVGYGTDHNAGLLKAFAEGTQGSYSIVENQEDAAGALGDSLGGALSCSAQNVVVHCPPGTTVSGPYTMKGSTIRIGDLYSGTDTLLLLELPEGPVTVSGTSVPDLRPFLIEATTSVSLERNPDIELTRLRYQCSGLFRQIRGWADLDSSGQDALKAAIESFRISLNDPVFADHPVAQMLIAEVPSLLRAVSVMQRPGRHYDMTARSLQHEAYTSLGRGTSSAIAAEEDPDSPPIHLQSPMSTRRQRQMATLMRTMSQQPEV